MFIVSVKLMLSWAVNPDMRSNYDGMFDGSWPVVFEEKWLYIVIEFGDFALGLIWHVQIVLSVICPVAPFTNMV